MNRKHLVVALCLISLIAVALTTIGQTQQGESLLQSRAIPEHVLYRQMFRHIHVLNQRAAGGGRHARERNSLRSLYQRQLGLRDEQSRVLSEIAEQCEREVAQLDERAGQIISEFRARFPGGLIPQGETLPPPPAELQAMQREREALILSYRDRLRAALGEEEFSSVNEFVQSQVAANIRPISPGPR